MSPQDHITAIVSQYKREYPDEYSLLCKAIDLNRKALKDPKFAQMEKNSSARALFEISETLTTMLIMGLSEDETVWFKSVKGSRWFAKTFREFALPRDV